MAGRFSAETRLPVSLRSVPTPVVQLAHHLRQLALGLRALALEPPDLALHLAELLVDGRDQPLDLLRAPGHLAGSALLLGAALVGSRCASESPVCASTSTRDRLHLVAHPLALQRLSLLVARAPATAPKRHSARGAKQKSNDQQKNAHHDHDDSRRGRRARLGRSWPSVRAGFGPERGSGPVGGLTFTAGSVYSGSVLASPWVPCRT